MEELKRTKDQAERNGNANGTRSVCVCGCVCVRWTWQASSLSHLLLFEKHWQLWNGLSQLCVCVCARMSQLCGLCFDTLEQNAESLQLSLALSELPSTSLPLALACDQSSSCEQKPSTGFCSFPPWGAETIHRVLLIPSLRGKVLSVPSTEMCCFIQALRCCAAACSFMAGNLIEPNTWNYSILSSQERAPFKFCQSTISWLLFEIIHVWKVYCIMHFIYFNHKSNATVLNEYTLITKGKRAMYASGCIKHSLITPNFHFKENLCDSWVLIHYETTLLKTKQMQGSMPLRLNGNSEAILFYGQNPLYYASLIPKSRWCYRSCTYTVYRCLHSLNICLNSFEWINFITL